MTSVLQKIQWKRVLLHLLFWLVIFSSFTVYTALLNEGTLIKQIVIGLFILPTDMLGVYLVIYWLFPAFFQKGKFIKFIVLSILLITILVLFVTIPIEYLVITWMFPILKKSGFVLFFKYRIMWDLIIKTMIIGLALSIKIGKQWITVGRKKQELENQKLQIELKFKEAELNYLKSQTNPHFLFNALNNLYGLTLKKSDRAPEVLLKISGLLDYMLYESKNSRIALNKEIENVKNYIEIQKLRYNDDLKVDFKLDGNFNNKTIAPILLMPIIENCFKHGLDETLKSGNIEISIFCKENELNLTTINSVDRQADKSVAKGGIGINNLQKRLDLEYNKRHNLDMNQLNGRYQVTLTIILD